MPSPFQQAGAAVEPNNAAPLHTNRFITGLWTQRSPIRDAATPYLYEKFYSASRFDSLWGGLNMELTVRLTLGRRPGSSIYNPGPFPPANRFFEFRQAFAQSEQIHVIGDFQQPLGSPLWGTIRDVTGPSTNLILANKGDGSGRTSFVSVGNTLYWSDGVNCMKWVLAGQQWAIQTSFVQGSFIVDPNNNIQLAYMGIATGTITAVEQVTDSNGGPSIKILVVTFNATAPQFAPLPNASTSSASFAGVTAHPEFNGLSLQVLTDQSYPTVAGLGPNQAAFISTTSGTFVNIVTDGTVTGPANGVSFTSGTFAPAWTIGRGDQTTDGTVIWVNKGSSVMKWGIDKPTLAPSTAQASLPTVFPSWTANTYFSPSLLIIDSNGNLQALTTPGTIGSSAPAWATATGATTTDGTAVWTNQGTATRANSTPYLSGAVIAVTFSYSVTYQVPVWNGYQMTEVTRSYPVTVTDFFKCTAPGTSGAAPPAVWSPGVGSTVLDGTVTWTNTGAQQTWASIGAGVTLSNASTIIDSNGNKQVISSPGKSGSLAPTWATATGSQTTDGTVSWTNQGPYSAAGTAPWYYAYAWKNSVTQHVSTASPRSLPLTLASDSMVVLQGSGSPDPQVDTIVLYRTDQGGSLLFWMKEIPAPANGAAWTYNSTEADTALVIEIQAQENSTNDPPPAGITNLLFYEGRIWGFLGTQLKWAAGPDTLSGVGNESFPPVNLFPYQAIGSRLWPTSLGLIAFTRTDAEIVLGSGTQADPFTTKTFETGLGLPNYDVFAEQGSIGYMLTPAKRLISLDPSSGVVEVGFPIGDQLKNLYDVNSAYLTFHEGSSDDTGLYVADGTQGWFRMTALTAPESGEIWSTRALIEGGVGCVQSIEVAPGDVRLLMGPWNSAHSGPILYRDDTVNADNEVLYRDCYADIGSVMLVQPGSQAGVEFITTDAKKVGTRPQIGVLLGEVSGFFETLTKWENDPPDGPAAATLWNTRNYLLQSQNSIWCRHMQVRVRFVQEDEPNELLTYTIFGSIEPDKPQAMR